MVWIWVPIKGTGTEADPWTPDIPPEIKRGSMARKPGDPRHLGESIVREMRSGHKDRGKPFLPLCRAWVADEDVEKVTKATTPDFRSETVIETWLLAGDEAAIEQKFRDIRAGAGAVFSADQRGACGEAVSVLVERGHISAAKGLEIAQEHDFGGSLRSSE